MSGYLTTRTPRGGVDVRRTLGNNRSVRPTAGKARAARCRRQVACAKFVAAAMASSSAAVPIVDTKVRCERF